MIISVELEVPGSMADIIISHNRSNYKSKFSIVYGPWIQSDFVPVFTHGSLILVTVLGFRMNWTCSVRQSEIPDHYSLDEFQTFGQGIHGPDSEVQTMH